MAAACVAQVLLSFYIYKKRKKIGNFFVVLLVICVCVWKDVISFKNCVYCTAQLHQSYHMHDATHSFRSSFFVVVEAAAVFFLVFSLGLK